MTFQVEFAVSLLSFKGGGPLSAKADKQEQATINTIVSIDNRIRAAKSHRISRSKAENSPDAMRRGQPKFHDEFGASRPYTDASSYHFFFLLRRSIRMNH